MSTETATERNVEEYCRPHCAACCIAPSVTSPLPGMPHGKPAGVPCVQLDEELRCKMFGKPERLAFCGNWELKGLGN